MIMTAESLPYVKDIPAHDGKFATKCFTDYNEALAWLSE